MATSSTFIACLAVSRVRPDEAGRDLPKFCVSALCTRGEERRAKQNLFKEWLEVFRLRSPTFENTVSAHHGIAPKLTKCSPKSCMIP